MWILIFNSGVEVWGSCDACYWTLFHSVYNELPIGKDEYDVNGFSLELSELWIVWKELILKLPVCIKVACVSDSGSHTGCVQG